MKIYENKISLFEVGIYRTNGITFTWNAVVLEHHRTNLLIINQQLNSYEIKKKNKKKIQGKKKRCIHSYRLNWKLADKIFK